MPNVFLIFGLYNSGLWVKILGGLAFVLRTFWEALLIKTKLSSEPSRVHFHNRPLLTDSWSAGVITSSAEPFPLPQQFTLDTLAQAWEITSSAEPSPLP